MIDVIRAKTTELLQTRKLSEKQVANTLLNKEEMKNKTTVLRSKPQRLVLELTNACNLNCIMCGRDESKFTLTTFNTDYLNRFTPILDTIEEVTLFGWGEPTLHPDFSGILKFLADFPVKKYFVTNGMLLNKFKEDIFKYQVDIIAVSLDGADAAINDKIRRGGNFKQITANISDIIAHKNTHNFKYPYINTVTTLMRSNLKQMPEMVRLASILGIEETKFVFLTAFSSNMLEENLYNCQEEVKEVFSETTSLARELGVKLKLPYIQGEDPAGNNFHKPCYVGWRDLFVGSDGYIRSCQSTPDTFFHIDKYSDITELWNSAEFINFRKEVNSNDLMPEQCRRCYQSSHTNQNRKESFIQTEFEFAPEWQKNK